MLYPIITSAEHLTLNIPIFTLFLNLICLFLITLLYEAPMTKRFNAVAFTYVFMFLMEMLALIAAGIFHFDLTDKASYVSAAAGVIGISIYLVFIIMGTSELSKSAVIVSVCSNKIMAKNAVLDHMQIVM